MTRTISGLSEIAGRYDVLLCDVWGVVHNGRESFPAACEALIQFQRRHGRVVLISNAPRPSKAIFGQLDDFGVPRQAWTDFVTSGDATRRLLAERAPGPAWAIGPERDGPLYEGLGLRFAGPEDAAFIVCTGLIDDTVETAEDYRQALAAAARRRLTMICANPDRVVQRGVQLIYCAGALADVYAELGGEVVMAGKPCAPIYDLALADAADRSRVLCVGDGIATDIAGANAQGLDCLFVLGGIHGAEAGEGAAVLLAREGAHAAYAAPALVW
jgi:HAD superfamily hydrolase (TIGR01459 family)